MKRIIFVSIILFAFALSVEGQAIKLTPHRIALKDGKSFSLNLPEGYEIRVAAEGLKRVRFFAVSPDRRIFVTDMHDLTDNKRGAVYILEDFDAETGRFSKVTPYMTKLQNPNSIAFHTDGSGQDWFYLALTDRLVRYKYRAGETAPAGEPQVLATFPDYGLSYKYGGWHLTRTIAFGANGKLYVAVGSSCNACVEKEDVRASVLEMDADGGRRRIYARGLRNAVGLKLIDGQLYATDMGSDHLGNNKPDDTMYALRGETDYGWPYCYEYRKKIYSDKQFAAGAKRCPRVPVANTAFSAHSSPLGFEYFDESNADALLRNSFLVALHGASDLKLKRGYRIMRVREKGLPVDFINGFLQNGKVVGRPCDVMRLGADAFLFTDDHAGVVYYVFKK
ncbi:MAG: PQQ-dependent sugar dehydrogenase [Acidobacteria bacterium]|nr:PQQ-dependent sugar dehydrogenase [Acidobacteriota bacterium]